MSYLFKILVLEDDEALNRSVCAYLNANGLEAKGCLNADDAYDTLFAEVYDLIISDIMMPETDGFEFAKTVRDFNANIPILFMTARGDIESKRHGFRIGIDDYMEKPVDLEELKMRIGALLRRAGTAAKRRLESGALTLDTDEHSAYLNGEEIPLTVREFNILFKLLSYPRKTFTRTQLMEEFWDFDSASSPRTVDVYITKLREKFKDCKDFEISTVHGLGYKAVLK